jgi:hypothetical protein
MRTSSAAKIEFAQSDISTSPSANSTLARPAPLPGGKAEPQTLSASRATIENAPDFTIPNFSAVFAATSREAGRINAASISPAEYQALLDERQSLLDKKFDGTMSKREENRLTYVRWSLDRIEDAKSGIMLDRLEEWVSRYEQFRDFVGHLDKQFMAHLPKKQPKK